MSQKASLWESMELSFAKPALDTQLLFLSEIRAYQSVGAPAKLDERIGASKDFKIQRKYRPQVLSSQLALSKKLELLDFDPAIVRVIAQGETSGFLSQALDIAVQETSRSKEIKQKSQGHFYLALATLVISLLALMWIPQIAAASLQELLASGLAVQTTFASTILLYLNKHPLALAYGLIASSALVAFAWYSKDTLLDMPWYCRILRPLLRYTSAKRSLSFMLSWKLHKRTGTPIEKDYRTLRHALGQRVMDRIHPLLFEGFGVAQAITSQGQHFSQLLVRCIEPFEELAGKDFEEAAKVIIACLADEQQNAAKRLTRTLYLLGALIAACVILLMVFGIIFPAMSINLA